MTSDCIAIYNCYLNNNAIQNQFSNDVYGRYTFNLEN